MAVDAAAARTSGDARALAAKGAALRRAGRLSEALPLLDAAIAAAPRDAGAWLERAYAFEAGGALEAAAENYNRAFRLDPRCAEAFAGFASVARLLGYPVATRRFAGEALTLDARNAVAVCALAAVDIAEGSPAAAVAALTALLAGDDVTPHNRAAAGLLLGDAHDRLGAADPAFAAYASAKSTFAALNAPHFAGRESHAALVARLDAELAALDPAASGTRVAPASPARTHAFLLGYPRSGTTLVENILATAPDVAAVEERPTLHTASLAFIDAPGGVARLAALSDAEAAPFRDAYWAKIAACGVALPAATLVDMDPLHSVKLPVIARLFPRARVVLMRRDPRDVVWSCFRTGFAANPAVMEFNALDRAARHYAATMTFVDRCLDRLPLDVHEVRYEDLVADFDAVSARLCDFLDIAWTPALRDFASTARTRGVTTASVGQVARGLYSGAGQWRRYARQFEAVEPILAPWIARFGAGG